MRLPGATHLVILSRRHAAEALSWTRGVMERIGLTLNEAKTRLVDAQMGRFDFLGYTFGPHRFKKDGHWYLGASPSRKSVARVKRKVAAMLGPNHVRPWEEVRNQLNWLLRGWSGYFHYGTRLMAYRAVDNYVLDKVRHFLRRRHKVHSRGTQQFSDEVVFGQRGVIRLRRIYLGAASAIALR